MPSPISIWIQNTMANFAELATEILEYSNIILSSNYWYIKGWFHLAVQLPSRSCVTAGGCSLIKANRLFILWHWAHVLDYRRFSLLFPRLYGPTVTDVQDELCPYLLLVEPVIGTLYVSTEFRHTFSVVLFWWQLLLYAFVFPEWRALCCSSAFVSQTGLSSCW